MSAPEVEPAAAEEQNDHNDDQQRVGIHEKLILRRMRVKLLPGGTRRAVKHQSRSTESGARPLATVRETPRIGRVVGVGCP